MLQAFFLKEDDAKVLETYSLHKKIVEVVVKELFIEDQDKVDSHIAMHAFKPVKNETGDVESYSVSMKNKAHLNHVLEMISAGLSFC